MNYLVGRDPAGWITNIPTYARVHYSQAYPGIDLTVWGDGDRLELEFLVGPGADPAAIQLAMSGPNRMKPTGTRSLALEAMDGRSFEGEASFFQEIGGAREEVSGGMVLDGGDRISFVPTGQDINQPLHIRLGVTLPAASGPGPRKGSEDAVRIASDHQGAIYVAGRAASRNESGPDPAGSAGESRREAGAPLDLAEAYVLKLSPDASKVVYATYFGGEGVDAPRGLTVSGEGRVLVTGWTTSASFPLFHPLQERLAGGSDAFIAELSAEGGGLNFATYLGGEGEDSGQGIAIGVGHGIWVSGTTSSKSFAVSDVSLASQSQGADAFLAKLDSAGSELDWLIPLGGNDADSGLAVALDGQGNGFVTGSTRSSNLATGSVLGAGGRSAGPPVGADAFVAKVRPDGSIAYLTYLGGEGDDSGTGIALDRDGSVFLTGWTLSADFPSSPRAPQPAHAGRAADGVADAFLAKLDSAEGGILFSTFLGGSHQDTATGIAVDAKGRAWVTGTTLSPDFPSARPPRLPAGREAEAWVAGFEADGTRLTLSGHFGGAGDETGNGIAVTPSGDLVLVGTSRSGGMNGARDIQPASDGSQTFIARIPDPAVDAQEPEAAGCPGSKNFDNGGGNGLWQTDANWNPDGAPGVGDDVCIAAGFSVTLSSGAQVVNSLTVQSTGSLNISAGSLSIATASTATNLTLSGGTLLGAGTVDVSGMFTWTGGRLDGPTVSNSILNANGGITLSGVNVKDITHRTLNSPGTATWTDGTIRGGLNSIINNTGTWLDQNAADESMTNTFGGTPAFNNLGSYQKSGATITTIGQAFNNNGSGTNTGSVQLTAGELTLTATGTSTEGTFTGSPSTTLRFNGGTYTVDSLSSISFPQVIFDSGTTNLNGTYTVTGTTQVLGGTANFNSAGSVANVGTALLVSSGTVNFSSGDLITPVTLNLSGGTLEGSDQIDVSGLFTWTGGRLDGPALANSILNANGGITLSGVNVKDITHRTLNSPGTATWTDGAIRGGLNSIINNTGTWLDQNVADESMSNTFGGTPAFNNLGSYSKNGATTTTIGQAFNINGSGTNAGSVQLTAGELMLTATGTSTEGTFTGSLSTILRFNGGTYTVDSLSSISFPQVIFDSGTTNLNGTYTVTDTTQVSGGTANFNSTSSVASVGVALMVSTGTANFSSGDLITPTNLNLSGGILEGSDQIDVSGLFTWTTGRLDGPALANSILNANGGISLSGVNVKDITHRTLNSPGTATWTDGTIRGGLNSIINNTGTWLDQNSANESMANSFGGTPAFNNLGSYQKSGAATTTISQAFNNNGSGTNTGSVQVTAGELELTATGTGTEGTFTGSPSTILRFNGGTYTVDSLSSISFPQVIFDSGTTNLNGTYTVTGTTQVSGGTANFNAPSTVANVGAALVVSSGTANFSSGDLITPTTLNLSGGTLEGSDQIDVSGLFTWTGGRLDGPAPANSILNANGGITLSGVNVKDITHRTLNSPGTATWTDGTIRGGLNSIINNTGTWLDQNTADESMTNTFGGTPAFNNLGSYQKSGAAITTIGQALNNNGSGTNTGSVQLTAGELVLTATGTSTEGTFTGGPSTILRFNGGTYTVDSLSSISFPQVIFDSGTTNLNGAYTVTDTTQVSGGTANFNAPSTVPNVGAALVVSSGTANFSSGDLIAPTTLNLSGGTLEGSDQVDVSGLFTWTAGRLDGPAPANSILNANGGMTLSGVNVKDITHRTLNNAGTATWTDGTIRGGLSSIINNSGTWLDQNAADESMTNTFGGTPAFNNLGSFQKNLAAITTIGQAFHNSGTVEVKAGELSFLPAGPYTQTAGNTILNGGTITSVPVLSIQGGVLSGFGIVTGDVTSSGTLSPGLSPNTLNISGNYIQGGGGSFAVELGGLAAGTQYDQVNVSGGAGEGVATLNGTLDVTLINGFSPALADSFTILNYLSGTGTFATENLPGLGAGLLWSVNYGSTSVVLTVVSAGGADLSLSKIDSPDPVNAGATLTYTLSVNNAGASTADTVSVTDTLPTGVVFQNAGGTGWTCNEASGVVTCTRATLALGPAPDITITVTAPSEGGTLNNSASVTATTSDPTPGNNSDSESTTVTPRADLSLVKTDNADPLDASAGLIYTLSVNNAGPSTAAALTVTDTLPAEVFFISASGTGWTCTDTLGAPVVTCTRDSLPPGPAPGIDIFVIPPGEGTISNSASVVSTTLDPVPGNNTDGESTTINPMADLRIFKVHSPQFVVTSQQFTYTLLISNGGHSTAHFVTATDTLPAGVTFQGVFSMTAPWDCNFNAGVLTCNRYDMAPTAENEEITLLVKAPATEGTISNTVSVTSEIPDQNLSNNSATDILNIEAWADLSVATIDDPDPVAPLAALSYTLSVNNAGPGTATNVIVMDTLPTGTTYQNGTGAGWICNHASGTVTCTRLTLSPGPAPDITINVTAPSVGGPITNSVEVYSDLADLNPVNNTDSESTTVNAPTLFADLSIAKSDSADPVDAGATFSYTLSVSNAGPDAASSVIVTDTLSTGTAYGGATGTGWACSEATGVVTCTRASLAPGPAPDITINVTAQTEAGILDNSATVGSSTPDPSAANNVDFEATTVTPISDLSVSKTDGPDPVNAAAALTYTLSVNNGGPSTAAVITVTDTLPAGVIYQSALGTGWTCGDVAGVVTCTQPSLAPGAAPDITITVTAPAEGGTLNNGVSIASATTDPISGNNTDSESTTVTPISDLSVSKADSPDPVNASASLTYTLGINNSGPSTAASLTVTDTLPAGVIYQNAQGSGWTCGHVAGVVTCTRPSLAPGGAPDITVVVTASSEGGSLDNGVSIASATTDPISGNNADSESTTVTPIADLSVTKTGTPNPVNASAALTYTLSVINGGPSTAASLTVTDTLPAGVTYQSALGSGWTCGHVTGVVTCTRATLAPGAAPAITIGVTAPAAGESITNEVTIASSTTDPNGANDSDSEDTTVNTPTSIADLSITKADSADPVNAGAAFSYTLSVSNTGPDTASAVTVTDTLPGGVAYGGAIGMGWACNQVSGVVTCTRASLAMGSAPDITINVTAPAAGGTVNNSATVGSSTSDPAPANNSATESTVVTPIADLFISKMGSPDPVNASAALTYTLSINNAGPSAAASLTVTDTLPAGVIYQSALGTGWTCVHIAGVVTCTRPSLAPGPAPDITITVTAPSVGGSITNNVTIAASTVDPNGANDSDSLSTTVNAPTLFADLSIDKADSADPVNAGAAFSYTLSVSNAGPDTASSVAVTDTLPAGVAYGSATGTGWTCNQASGVVTCTRASLTMGSAPDITINVTAPASGGTVNNSATVGSATSDPTPGNNTDTERTTVTPIADLSIIKSDSPDPVNASATLSYTLSINNAGPSAASSVTVTDTLPAGVNYTSASGTGWTCNQASGVVTCTRASLAMGTAPNITISVTTPASGGALSNTAAVGSSTSDPNMANNSDTESTLVSATVASHDLAVVNLKVPQNVQFNPNKSTQSGRVAVVVRNNSPHDETILNAAMLANLVTVSGNSLGACPSLTPVFRSATRSLPATLNPGQQIELSYDVQFTAACINDPRKSTGNSQNHDDYRYTATVHHSALDGQADAKPGNDVCPRSSASPQVPACPVRGGPLGAGSPVDTDVVMSGP